MDKRTRLLYNDSIYQEVLSRFGIDPGSVRELDGFESFIYEYEKDGRSYILRISHSLHHPSNFTWGEIDFLYYLAEHGMRVPHPYPSAAGNLVEVIPVQDDELGESCFSAVTFDKAPGGPPRREDWTPELYQAMGRFMGRLHTLSQAYQPSRPEYRRYEWYEDEEDYADRYLPASEALIAEKFKALVQHLKSLPRDPGGYGLIHVDFHGSNFFIDRPDGKGSQDGLIKITLFDFDDCCYAPYVYDIAMALFYAVPHHCETPNGMETARTFYHNFMQGYREEFDLDPAWLKEIPNFLKLREMALYIVIHRSFESGKYTPWVASFMDGRKERLEGDVPYIPMEFGA